MSHKQSSRNKNRLKQEVNQTVVDVASKPYKEWFPEARSHKRKFYLHIGPTNSGKTHDALEALKKASAGVYLAPLRLLALEVGEDFRDEGIPCNIITGEDRNVQRGARITASTVEMMNPNKSYDIAVIDEAQMVGDLDRGGGWTSAILGVDADEIHVCLAPEGLVIVKKLIKSCFDEFTVIKHERKTTLAVQPHMVDLDKNELDKEYGPDDGKGRKTKTMGVRRGDAIVCFSRAKVLQTAASLESMGIKTSIVYGALPWAVRRNEARKFREHETDVVVATDAIGMGLNLPIHRVVFSEISKFDGEEIRQLTVGEIKQIAGRAGRMGLYDEGYVTVATGRYTNVNSIDVVRRAVEGTSPAINNAMVSMPMKLKQVEKYPLFNLIAGWRRVNINKLFTDDEALFMKENTDNQLMAAQFIESELNRFQKLKDSPLVTRDKIISLTMVQFNYSLDYQYGLWKDLTDAWFHDILEGSDDFRRTHDKLPGGKEWANEHTMNGDLATLENLNRCVFIEYSFARLMGFLSSDMNKRFMDFRTELDQRIMKLIDGNKNAIAPVIQRHYNDWHDYDNYFNDEYYSDMGTFSNWR